MEALSSLLQQAERVSVLTGAGVSTLSGIPDFQTIDANWSWTETREQSLSVNFMHRRPGDFWERYRYLFGELTSYQPNIVHERLAQLETETRTVQILTQNVDGLHQKAGSSSVLELHGNASRTKCPRCGAMYSLEETIGDLPRCSNCRKSLRPDTVLFGDQLREFRRGKTRAEYSDVLLVVGTSLQVGPVNLIPKYAANFGVPCVWMNAQEPPDGYDFAVKVIGDLSDTVKLL